MSTESKVFRRGSIRACDPSETLARALPKAEDLGVTRVANVTGLDRIGIPVTMVVRPRARSVSVCQGKGATLLDAKVSGLMEAVELHHAENFSAPLRLGSHRQLGTSLRLADPERLPRPRTSPWNADLPLLWTEGENLFDRAPVWVPAEMVDANFVLPRRIGDGCFQSSTNGLAAGNTWEEALVHALCELIERDGLGRWYELDPTARRASRIDRATVSGEPNTEYLEKIEAAGLDLAIWALPTVGAIPAFTCTLWEAPTDGGSPKATDGAGCHPDANIALARAISEAAQSRLTYIAAVRDDLRPEDYSDPLSDRRRIPEAVEDNGPPGRPFDPESGWRKATFEEDLEEIMARLAATGIDTVAAVDLSLPEFRIPVVRAIVPGLRGMTGAARDWQELS